MIKAGIIGATGYAGAELVRILMNHKEVEIAWYGSRSYVDENYADIYGNMFQIVDAKCMDDNMEELAESRGLGDVYKRQHMRNGTRLSTSRRSLLMRPYMVCVR